MLKDAAWSNTEFNGQIATLLGQPGQLPGGHVPRAGRLVAGDQGLGERLRVRHGQRGQRGHPPRIAAGHVPGQGRAPVVPGQVEPFRSGRVSQGQHVRRQLGVPVREPAAGRAPGE